QAVYPLFDVATKLVSQTIQNARALANGAIGGGARHRFDATHAGRDALLPRNEDVSDVAGPIDMRAAAQLAAVVAEADHADPIAVLLAEEGHRSGGQRFLVGCDRGLFWKVSPDLEVNSFLDPGQVLR